MKTETSLSIAAGAGTAGFLALAAVARNDDDTRKKMLTAAGIVMVVSGLYAGKEHPFIGGLVALSGLALAVVPHLGGGSTYGEKPVGVGLKAHDVPIGGNWTMLDVGDRTKVSLADRQAAGSGAIVTVLLDNGAGGWPYPVTILGKSGRADLPLNGVWSLVAPPFGPQTLDFGPEHIFTLT